MFSLLQRAPCTPQPCLLDFIRPLQTNLPKWSGTQTQRRSCHPVSCPICSSRVDVPCCAVGFWGPGCIFWRGLVLILRLSAVKTLWQLLPTLKSKPHRTHKSHEPVTQVCGTLKAIFQFSTRSFFFFGINLSSFFCDRHVFTLFFSLCYKCSS